MDALQIFLGLVKKNEDFIVQLNTRSQLYDKGIRSDKSKIDSKYSEPYKKRKANLGIPTDHITLYLSGQYHSSYKVTISNKEVDLDSNYQVKGFDLAEHLRKRYGLLIEGLTPESEETLWNKIEPEFMAIFDQQLITEFETNINKAFNDL